MKDRLFNQGAIEGIKEVEASILKCLELTNYGTVDDAMRAEYRGDAGRIEKMCGYSAGIRMAVKRALDGIKSNEQYKLFRSNLTSEKDNEHFFFMKDLAFDSKLRIDSSDET